jgi:hypothetical protein
VLGALVDVPASFSRRGISSVGIVWTTALAVQVVDVVALAWMTVLTVVVGSSHSAALPRSSPSSIPNFLPSSIACIWNDLRFAPIAVSYAQSQNRERFS